ncbi:MAG: GNAT family N-acetyltransferase [Sphingomonas paucimobilis]
MDIRLRPVRPDDLDAFYDHQCDVDAAAMAGFTPRSRADFDAHWGHILAGPAFVVATIEVDERVAGYVSTFPRDGRREIAFWLDRAVWNRGVGRAAVTAFLVQHPERPLLATVLDTNTASRTVLQRCGFRVVGRETDPDGVAEVVLRLD